MNGDVCVQCDPIAKAKAVLMDGDLEYWIAHPEIPAIVSYLVAKVTEQQPHDIQQFARDLFNQDDFEDQVRTAMSRHGRVLTNKTPKEHSQVRVKSTAGRERHED